MMTVQELIDLLNKIEDETLPVQAFDHEYGDYYDIQGVGEGELALYLE